MFAIPFWALFTAIEPARDGGRVGSPAELAERFARGAAVLCDVDGAALRAAIAALNLREGVGAKSKVTFVVARRQGLTSSQLGAKKKRADEGA